MFTETTQNPAAVPSATSAASATSAIASAVAAAIGDRAGHIILEGYDGPRPTRFLLKNADLARAAAPGGGDKLGGVHIGRAGDNDISLSSGVVSRHHAVLVRSQGQIFVIDLGSANGTWVDGAQITPGLPAPVAAGSEISFGHAATMTLTA